MISACAFGITALAMVMVYPFGNRGIVAFGNDVQNCTLMEIYFIAFRILKAQTDCPLTSEVCVARRTLGQESPITEKST
jgi:hypothetical protein